MSDNKLASKIKEAEVRKETVKKNSNTTNLTLPTSSSSKFFTSTAVDFLKITNSLSESNTFNKKEQYKTITFNTFYKQKECNEALTEGSIKIQRHNWNQEFQNLILGQKETFTIKESFGYMKRKLSQKGFISKDNYEIGKVKDSITVTEDFDDSNLFSCNLTQKATPNTQIVKNTEKLNQIISPKSDSGLETILEKGTGFNKNSVSVQEKEFKRPEPVKPLSTSGVLPSQIDEANITLDSDASVIFQGFYFQENGKTQNLNRDASVIILDESKTQVVESDASVIIISDSSKLSNTLDNISLEKEMTYAYDSKVVDSNCSVNLSLSLGSNHSEEQLIRPLPFTTNREVSDESLILLDFSEDKAPKDITIDENSPVNLTENHNESLAENSIENFDLKCKIEKHVAEILQCMVKKKIPYFSVPRYNKLGCGASDVHNTNNTVPSKFKTKSVKCHGRSIGHFSSMIYLLGQIYSLLISNSKCTKRELYYRNQELFFSQTASDLALNDLSVMLNCPLWKMGILSSSKGLLAGDLKVTNDEGEISYTRQKSSTVPNDLTNVKRITTEAKFILVVEKDTVFQRLIDDGIFEKLEKDMLLITGKGYPDINTRRLLQKLMAEYNLPAYILVDADPHGLEIMFTYRFGSKSLAHEADELICPNLNWIGVKPSDTLIFNMDHEPLTEDDLQKLKSQLSRPYIPTNIRKEIKILMKSNRKSEIECLYKISPSYLIDEYLKNSLKLCDLEKDDVI